MQTQETTAPHFDQITRALADKIGSELDEDDLRDEFQKYLDYGVPPDQAVRTILRHHGAPGNAPAPSQNQERVQLADLKPDTPYVNILARVLTIQTRTVTARGEEKQIVTGMLGDETASRAYTSWRPLEGIEKGDVLEVQGAYTKEFRNEVQVNFGDRCQIAKKGDEALPKAPDTFRPTSIGDLEIGLRGLEVTARVLDISTKEVNVQGEPKTIWTGTLADETGKVEFTAWSDPGLEKDQTVTIQGGYVRGFRGMPQFNFDDDATITPSDKELPDADTLADTPPVALHTLVDKGANDVTVVATLLEVRDGSGLVFRDPETNRVVRGSNITDESIPDLRIKGVLDDGTAALNLIANRELTEDLLGKNLDEARAMAKEAFRSEIVQEKLQEMLTGRVFKARGNVLVDEYGAMFIARSLAPYTPELAAEAQELIGTIPEVA